MYMCVHKFMSYKMHETCLALKLTSSLLFLSFFCLYIYYTLRHHHHCSHLVIISLYKLKYKNLQRKWVQASFFLATASFVIIKIIVYAHMLCTR